MPYLEDNLLLKEWMDLAHQTLTSSYNACLHYLLKNGLMSQLTYLYFSTILVFSVLITHLFALGCCLLHSLFPDMTIWFVVLSHSESLLFPALILLPAASLVDDFTHFSWGFPATNLFLLFFFDQNLLSNTEEKLKNSSFDNFTLSKWVKVYHNGW